MHIGPTPRASNYLVASWTKYANLRVLLIVTFRPEFEPPWIGRPHVTALTLNRLGEREIDAMIDRVTGNKLLPASIRQDIIERTDGIPLFVEEMTKAVLEAESQGAAERVLMVRMEAAVRLQEQTASLSSSRFVPFALSNQFLLRDNTARPVDRSWREVGNGQVS